MERYILHKDLIKYKGVTLLEVVFFLSYLSSVSGGICWYSISNLNLCKKVYNMNMTQDDCCKRNDLLSMGWSPHNHMSNGQLFYWERLTGGVPNCSRCHSSCQDITCQKGKVCRMKNGLPRCVCKPRCPRSLKKKGAICGSDTKNYKNYCRLMRENCKNDRNIKPSYFGKCKKSCKKVRCLYGNRCLEDQNGLPHCVQCSTKCTDVTNANYVCGDNKVTYRSICHVRAATCMNQKSISIAYSGVCRDNATCSNTPCPAEKHFKCLLNMKTLQPHCMQCSNCCSIYSNGSAVCGTDGVTYASYCQLKKTACQTGVLIRTKHSGRCRRYGKKHFKDCNRKRCRNRKKWKLRQQKRARKSKSRFRSNSLEDLERHHYRRPSAIALNRIIRYRLHGKMKGEIT